MERASETVSRHIKLKLSDIPWSLGTDGAFHTVVRNNDDWIAAYSFPCLWVPWLLRSVSANFTEQNPGYSVRLSATSWAWVEAYEQRVFICAKAPPERGLRPSGYYLTRSDFRQLWDELKEKFPELAVASYYVYQTLKEAK